MRKSGKLLLGVLSVAALIGTGMGAFVINGTYGAAEDSLTVGTTEEYYSRGFNISATKPAEAKIQFDGDGGTLGFTYTVSAEPVTGGLTKAELYNPDTWATVAQEYRPNLKISASYSGTNQAGFEKYVVLPADVTIDYTTWLAEGLVDDGYKHDFAVQWNSANLGGYNTPNDYFKTVNNATGQTVLDEIKAALAGATIVVKFEAGYFDSTSTPTPDPVETTGAVTLPDADTSNALLTISGTQDDGTIAAGQQTLSLTLEEGYELDTAGLTVAVDGKDPVNVPMSEVQSQVLSLNKEGKKYTGTYTFVAGSKYVFAVAVKESAPVVTYATIAKEDVANATIDVTTGQVATGTEVKFKVTPDEDYAVTEVYYTVDNAKTTLVASNGEYSFVASEEKTYTIGATVELQLSYTKISAINTAIDEIDDNRYLETSYVTRGYVTGWTDVNSNYNSRTNIYIADGENAISLYSVPTDKLADIQIGDLVEVSAAASSVGKYGGTKQIIFNSDGATNTITKVDSDATVTVPSSIVLNDETQASVSFDTTAGQARRVEISDAVFVNIGGYSNRYAYFTVNSVQYGIYLTQADNACYDEIVSLAEGNKFACTAFVGQFSGDLQFIGVTDLVVAYDDPVSVAFDETVGDTLTVGGSVKLAATVSPATAKQSVTYSIIDGGTFASLDTDGVTLIANAAGSVTVRASVSEAVYIDKVITINAATGDELVSLYTTGFESSEGYAATTDYRNTTEKLFGPDGSQWGTIYGTATTTAKDIIDPSSGQVMQNRYYSGQTVNPELYTKFATSSVKTLKFSYVWNNLGSQSINNTVYTMEVYYSSDVSNGGLSSDASWTMIESVPFNTLVSTTTVHNYEHTFDDLVENFQVRIVLNLNGSAPSGTGRFTFDNFEFIGRQ